MAKSGFFNIILILSFLLSDIGITQTNQITITSPWKPENIFRKIGGWINDLKFDLNSSIKAININDNILVTPIAELLPTHTPQPYKIPTIGITPTQLPLLR